MLLLAPQNLSPSWKYISDPSCLVVLSVKHMMFTDFFDSLREAFVEYIMQSPIHVGDPYTEDDVVLVLTIDLPTNTGPNISNEGNRSLLSVFSKIMNIVLFVISLLKSITILIPIWGSLSRIRSEYL